MKKACLDSLWNNNRFCKVFYVCITILDLKDLVPEGHLRTGSNWLVPVRMIMYMKIYLHTSSNAQGGGGSFKDRKL